MKSAFVVFAAALGAHVVMSTALAAELKPSMFSYRGQLTDGGTPANGLYDLAFRLFDAPTGGSQIGNTIDADNAGIQDGAVTIDLDFGAQTFAGPSRWLEIGVRSGSSTDSYTPVGSRQQITGSRSTTFAMRPDPEGGGGDNVKPAVMYFNLMTCPDGWIEFNQGRGRYVVGYQPGGGIGHTVGTALGVAENRPCGQHSHGINDPGHSHTYSAAVATSMGSGNSQAGYETRQTSRDTTGITIKDEGTVPGTNAPYILLLMCTKP